MKRENVSGYDNFDDENLKFIERKIKEDKDSNSCKRAYTMLQNNSNCDVVITKSSREKCATMLLK